MAVYACLVFLSLGLVTLVWGRHADPRHRAVYFGVGVTFAALAAMTMVVAAVRSLWFYPLS